jgi:tRNA(Arg) A34 adenosine deaminase TadA
MLVTMAQHTVTALIYDKRGKVLSVGQNSYIKTHPLQAKHARKTGNPEKQYLHAEVHAITRCRNLSRAYKIFVARYNKNGEPVLAAPCPVCTSAIRAAGIKYVQHT